MLPKTAKRPRSPARTDYLGKNYRSIGENPGAQGRSKSSPFTIESKAINFLVMGGKHRDSTCINLLVNGKIVENWKLATALRFSNGPGWDVRPWLGKKAQLELVDLSSDQKTGFIAIDHIMFSDQLTDQHLEHALWLDNGPDYYATRTWRNYDKENNATDSVFAIGWMGNWDYARLAPSKWGKGFQSIPRMMTLKETPLGFRILQRPIPQLAKLRTNPFHEEKLLIKGAQSIKGFTPQHNSYELDATFTVKTGKVFGFNLLMGEGRKLELSYDSQLGVLTVDRRNCTNFLADAGFTKSFATKFSVPLILSDGKLRLHIFVDRSSVGDICQWRRAGCKCDNIYPGYSIGIADLL